MTGTAHLERRGAIGTITIDNPSKRNALGPPLIEEIVSIVDGLGDDVRVLVLTGTGEKAFSSGFDVSYYADDAAGGGDDDFVGTDHLAARLKRFEYPTLAMINGGAYGGAMHVLAACDLRVAVDDAEFGITPAKLGLVYSGEAISEVTALVGPANAKEFLLTADFVDAQRAYDMGFLNRIVPRDELEETTYGLAERIAQNAPLSLVGMKAIVRALIDHGSLTAAERDWAQRLRAESKASRDHREGAEAFMEGREPEFVGE